MGRMKMPMHKTIKAMVMEEANIKRMKTQKKGNNGNADENDGGGEEVGAEDDKKENFPRTSVANLIQPSPIPPTLINLIRTLSKNLQSMMIEKEKNQKGEEEEVHL